MSLCGSYTYLVSSGAGMYTGWAHDPVRRPRVTRVTRLNGKHTVHEHPAPKHRSSCYYDNHQ